LATNGPNQFFGDQQYLDDSGTYFDLGPRQITAQGVFNYFSTRNNDFSNRDQKGTIIVSPLSQKVAQVGWNGATVLSNSGTSSVYAAQGAFTSLVRFTITTSPSTSASSLSGGSDSDYVEVLPLNLPLTAGSTITVSINYQASPLMLPTAYRATDYMGSWEKVDASFSSGVASIPTSSGGIYAVQTSTNWGAVVGIVLALLVVIGGGFYYVVYKNKMPSISARTTKNMT